MYYKEEWISITSNTCVLNTATGCLVDVAIGSRAEFTADAYAISITFIPGENYSHDRGFYKLETESNDPVGGEL